MNKTFTEKYMIIKSCFPGEYSNRHALGAFLCMVNDRENREAVSREKIMACKKMLKSKVSLSSSYRDYLKLPLVIKMALSEDPEKYLQGITETFNNIQETYFTGSGQKFVTAMAIYDNCEDDEIQKYCDRMYSIYGIMKKEHPFITGQEDMIFSALLAIDGEELDSLLEEMEICYDLLRNRFRFGINPIQNVSHVLSLTDVEPEIKTSKFIEMYEKMKDNTSRTRVGPQSIVLAALSVLDISADEGINEVISTDEYLRTLKGFGRLGIDPKVRKMIAAALTAAAHLPEDVEIIHGVRVELLRTILSTAMIGGMILTRSSLEMSAHR